ncbi:hypothetical protein KA531_00075 [Candidatus Saccharibacteria bacterium]|nr:hypothetical protein [Candidatus Saccharibacteria bacterium]
MPTRKPNSILPKFLLILSVVLILSGIALTKQANQIISSPVAQQTNTANQLTSTELFQIESDLTPNPQQALTKLNQFSAIIYLPSGTQETGYQENALTRNIGSINNFGQLFSNLLKGPNYLEANQGILPVFELSGKSPNIDNCLKHYDYYQKETDQEIVIRFCRDIKIIDQDPEYQALAKDLIKKTLDQNYNKAWQLLDKNGQPLL